MSTYLLLEGVQSGPYSDQEIMDFFNAHKISASTLCWKEGLPEWKGIAEIFPEIGDKPVKQEIRSSSGHDTPITFLWDGTVVYPAMLLAQVR